MKRYHAIVASLMCVGVSLSLLAGCNKEENKKAGETASNAVQKTGNAVSNAGEKIAANVAPTGSANDEGIRNLLSKLADDGVSKDSLNNVANLLAAADRDRIKPALDKSDSGLNAAIDQFQKSWKDKYGKDFSPKDVDTIYDPSFVAITEGTSTTDQATTAAAANDRKTKTVTIKESHGMPALEIPVVSEAGLWKIDAPDNLDAAMLKANLTKAVENLNKDPSTWPADINDGYRAVTHAVAAAVMNKL